MRDFKKEIDNLFNDFRNAKEINEENLKKILKDNANTYYGKRYSFSDISSIEQYRNTVPLSVYADYDQGIEYNYEKGYSLATSGTLGTQKKFTVSKLAMQRSEGYNYIMPLYLMDIDASKGAHISAFRDPQKETLLSCALFDYLYQNGYYTKDDFYGWDFHFTDSRKNIPYIKLRAFLAHKDIRYIGSIFIYDLLIVFRYLEDNWRLILDDIKNNKVSVEVSDGDVEKLLKIEYSKERIEELEEIFNYGFEDPVILRLFPDIRFVSGVGGGKYAIYDQEIRRYTGNLPIYYYIFAQTECTMGVPLQMDKAIYAMMPKTAFYEYLDLDENKTYLPDQLTIGKDYEVIVTTFSGLYRYHTGDRIKVVGYQDQAPLVEVLGRINSIINIAGEKVDDADITFTMSKLSAKYQFRQFAVGVDHRVIPNRYILFVETDKLDKKLVEDFDNVLSFVAEDYHDLRSLQAINPPIAKSCTNEQFSKLQKGQIKPKVVLSDSQVKEWLEDE